MALPSYQKASAAPKAEPKKRARKANQGAAIVPSETPSNKRVKTSSAAAEIAAANAATAKHESIKQALREAQCVPTSVRDMLCSTLAGSCCITGEFHPFQEKLLRMLKDTLKDIRAEKTRIALKAASITTRVKEELKRFERSVASAEAALSASSADVKDKEGALAKLVASLQPFRAAFDKAQGEVHRGDAVIGAAAMDIEQLRAVRARTAGASEEALLQMLQEFATSSGWEFAPDKFASPTLLEGEICQRLAMLSERVSKHAVARVGIVAQLKVALMCLNKEDDKKKACASALAQAESERRECAVTLKARAQTLKQHKLVVAQTVKAWNNSQNRLAAFQKGPHAAFKGIVKDIEKQHGIEIFHADPAMVDQEVESDSPEFETKTDHDSMPVRAGHRSRQRLSLVSVEAPDGGTPVIDRRQRQAILRRRSAVLPVFCFNRLSLVARRSSVGPKRRSSIDAAGSDSFKTCGSETDDEKAEGCSFSKASTSIDLVTPVKRKSEQRFGDGAMDVPTPSRNSLGGGIH